MANDWQVGLIGHLDGTKSKNQLNQDIDAIKKTLKDLELKAKLDPNQVKALESQLNNLKVSLNNVSFDQTSLNNLVSQINNSLSGIKLQIPNLNTGNVGNQARLDNRFKMVLILLFKREVLKRYSEHLVMV